jgi:SsrA-binding protein
MAKKAKKARKPVSGDVATNRRARQKFELLDRFECGIELLGTEVKSLREGKAQLGDAYAVIEKGEVWLRNAYIPPYGPAASQNHDPERPRKLLLHRYEIERLVGRSQRRGLTLIPTRIYFKGPRAKVELALARGKDQRDRRREIRDRDVQREIDRELSGRGGKRGRDA